MANYNVNNNILLQWQEFSTDSVDYVRLYYKIGLQAEVFVSNLDNSYSTAVDANADGNNRHSYNLVVTEDMIGSDVIFIIKDGTEDDISLEVSGPHEIYVFEEKVNGSTWTIEWSDFISDIVDIHYRINDGSWTLIESGVANHTIEFGSGSYEWIVDTGACDSIEIRILDVENDVYIISPSFAIVESTGIVGAGSISLSTSSTLSGIVNLISSTQLSITSVGTLSSLEAVSGSSSISASSSATVTGLGNINSTTQIQLNGSGTLTGILNLTSVSTISFSTSSVINSYANMTSTTDCSFLAEGSLSGLLNLIATSGIVTNVTGVIDSVFAGSSAINITSVGILTGIGSITGSSNVVFEAIYRNWFIRSYKRNRITSNFVANKNNQKQNNYIKNFNMINNKIDTTNVRKSNQIVQNQFDTRVVNNSKRLKINLMTK